MRENLDLAALVTIGAFQDRVRAFRHRVIIRIDIENPYAFAVFVNARKPSILVTGKTSLRIGGAGDSAQSHQDNRNQDDPLAFHSKLISKVMTVQAERAAPHRRRKMSLHQSQGTVRQDTELGKRS